MSLPAIKLVDNITRSNKTGRGDKVTPNNNKTGGITTLESKKDLREKVH